MPALLFQGQPGVRLQNMPPPEPPQPPPGDALPTAARWLAGILIVLAIAAGATYSYRQQAELRRGRAEWEAEVARIRESGDPLTGAELDAFYVIPDGEDDLTPLYLKALEACQREFDTEDNLPIVGSKDGDTITIPPEPWPDLEAAEAHLAQYRIPLQELAAAEN